MSAEPRRWRAVVEYDGTEFSGWQRQDGQRTVQGVVEDAIRQVVGESVFVRAAGRTDAGVHADGQVVSFDLFDWSEDGGWQHAPGKGAHRAFVCKSPNAWSLPAKDRSGRLDLIEEPHLGRLIAKINGSKTEE